LDRELDLSELVNSISEAESRRTQALERFKAELRFAVPLAKSRPEKTQEWEALIRQATTMVVEGLRAGRSDIDSLVSEAEGVLAPLGEAAKEYAIYCCGHGHVDMLWLWTWPETVATCYDTLVTMDRLMDEFPQFRFSQSQTSIYQAMHKYAPELFERIKQRIAEGRWEVTASTWVEGDKNMVSGESLCRQVFYTRRWFKEVMGIDYDQVKIDWECDTFGHCWTLPGILRRSGVTRYYHHRNSPERVAQVQAGKKSILFWWEGKDGSRVLVFDDSTSPRHYNNRIAPEMVDRLFNLERLTGLKCMLWVYGVGDHGGGPTREDLRKAVEMQSWPIWPQVKLSTTDEYFNTVEKQIAEQGLEVPVYKEELNCVFDGCYTSQSRIKFAHRKSENNLAEAEAVAYLAHRLGEMPYPIEALTESWQRTLFVQFHDILPGSGAQVTREYAMGLLQQALADSGMVKTRSLRALAARVDTSALATQPGPGTSGDGLGAGVGSETTWGDVSKVSGGQEAGDPFIIFNPSPFSRDEVVTARVWNRDLEGKALVVRDSDNNAVVGQVTATGDYWGHHFADVAFPVKQLPALGYRAYTVQTGKADLGGSVYVKKSGRPVHQIGSGGGPAGKPIVLGNEHLELVINAEEGGIVSLVDKHSGVEFVAPGRVLGTLVREQEAPHVWTAWNIGPIVERVEVMKGSVGQVLSCGPNVGAVKLTKQHNDSEYELTIRLAADSRQVEFILDVNWLERGDPETGVPTLRVLFPLAIEKGRATFEIPCGTIERPADNNEYPALNWADLTGQASGDESQLLGATLLNNSRHGYRASENTLQLSLLRSSYDPDPLPELGQHQICYALVPHLGPLDTAAAIRAAHAFNHPCIPVATTAHEGDLPGEHFGLEILSPNVMLSGMKRAEDSDALVVRLYEFEGQGGEARVRLSSLLAEANSAVVETDILERPLPESSARMEGDVLVVKIPAYGIATLKIGS